jgi:hypothetical protein
MLLAGMPTTNASRPAAVAAAAAFRAVAPFLDHTDRTALQHVFASSAPKECLVAVLEVVIRITSAASTNGLDSPGLNGRFSRLSAGETELSPPQGRSFDEQDRSPARQDRLQHQGLRPLSVDEETPQFRTLPSSSPTPGRVELDSILSPHGSNTRFPGTSPFMPGGLFSDFPSAPDVPITNSTASASQSFGFGGSSSLSPFVTAPAGDMTRRQSLPFGHADDASVSSADSSGRGGSLWSTSHPFGGSLASWASVPVALNTHDSDHLGNAFVSSDLSSRQLSFPRAHSGYAGESLWVTPAPGSDAISSPISQPGTHNILYEQGFSACNPAALSRFPWNAQGSDGGMGGNHAGYVSPPECTEIARGSDMDRDREGPARSRAGNLSHLRFSAPK